MLANFHEHEFALVTALQKIRSPWLDTIFYILNIFNADLTYLVIIILVWHLIDEEEGFHLLYLNVINASMVIALKNFFAEPRPPYSLMPLVSIVDATYAFPSGAASCALVSFGFLFFLHKSSFIQKIIAASIILLAGFTRIYLGDHFPSDVIGGYALGAVILIAYTYIIPFVMHAAYCSRYYQLLIHASFILFLIGINPSKDMLLLTAFLAGAIIWHIWFNSKYAVKNTTPLSRYNALFCNIVILFILGIALHVAVHQTSFYAQCISIILMMLMGASLGASTVIAHYLQCYY